jgi:hypothetical protein
MAEEFQRIKSTYLSQADINSLTYENFLNLCQSAVDQIASRISNLNDRGIFLGLFLRNTGIVFSRNIGTIVISSCVIFVL